MVQEESLMAGETTPVISQRYEEAKALLVQEVGKLDVKLHVKNIDLTITGGRIDVATFLKGGSRRKTIHVQDYFDNRLQFTLPERRAVVKAIKDSGVVVDWQNARAELDTIYSVYLTFEQMLEVSELMAQVRR